MGRIDARGMNFSYSLHSPVQKRNAICFLVLSQPIHIHFTDWGLNILNTVFPIKTLKEHAKCLVLSQPFQIHLTDWGLKIKNSSY